MSLADELLAALDEGGQDEDDYGDDRMEVAEVGEETSMQIDSKNNSIHDLAKLRDGKELQAILKEVEYFSKITERKEGNGPVEADPEYKLIVEANNIVIEIDNEINLVHKFTRDVYNKRFPELESLVQQPIEYVQTVMELGNNIDRSKNNEMLQEILTPATIMVVSVTASTTQGQELSKEDLQRVMDACNMALDLLKHKMRIYEYVESRMSFIAPNLSNIVGASTAAKIMGIAGGLTHLSKMPACNILLLGAQKKTLSGFSTKAIIPHTGYIYYSDTVQKTPPEFRKKAARLIASKCCLAARVDSFHEYLDGEIGQMMCADITTKIEKLQEPPPIKQIKPLPAPIDVPRKKRGGRRYRKMKERLGMTDIRKQANRMNFGEIEEDAYQEDLGLTLGNLGKKNSGKVRGPVIDSKTKARISKTLQQKIQKQQTWGGSTSVKRQISGTASSVAFTPLQGLEIVNPQAAEHKILNPNLKYFSNTAAFVKVDKTPVPNKNNLEVI